jgi:hypothetical protein
LPTTGRPFVAGVEDLRAGEALLQAVEAVGVDGGVAVDEGVLELVGAALTLSWSWIARWSLTLPRRLDDERVDVGVAAEDDQRLGLLVDGAGRLGVGRVHGAELDAGQRRLLVVGVGVALDRHQRDPVEQNRLLHERLEDALLQLVLRQEAAWASVTAPIVAPPAIAWQTNVTARPIRMVRRSSAQRGAVRRIVCVMVVSDS